MSGGGRRLRHRRPRHRPRQHRRGVIAGWIFGINPLTLLGMMSGAAAARSSSSRAPAPAPPSDDPGALRLAGAAQHRGPSGPTSSARRAGLPAAEAGAVHRRVADRLRPRPGRDGAVLLPERPEGLHRPELLRRLRHARLGASRRVRPGLRDRARGRPPRAEPDRHHAARSTRAQRLQAQANALSVRVELQADCFAGVWAARSQAARLALEPGDIEEALNAAAQIGDDTLQRRRAARSCPRASPTAPARSA